MRDNFGVPHTYRVETGAIGRTPFAYRAEEVMTRHVALLIAMTGRVMGLLSFCLPTGCGRENTDSAVENAFVHNPRTGDVAEQVFAPNPMCTMPSAWDPEVGMPSSAAVSQLSPSGTSLRIGVTLTNPHSASLQNGVLVGPAIDISCRLATKLQLPIEFKSYGDLPSFLAAFRANAFEVGFSFDPLLADTDLAVANPYVGVPNTYAVLSDSPFMSVNDLDQPGVKIGVMTGNSPAVYLAQHLKYATLLTFAPGGALNALLAGQVDAAASGRPALTTFVTTGPGKGKARIMPDNIFYAMLAPFMHLNNADGICYLRDYIEAAKTSGLIYQALNLITPPVFPSGSIVAPAMPTCTPFVKCQNVTVPADGSCHASASINAGSDDADSDLAGCTQSPAGSYALGTTPVTLTCTDTEGLTSTCMANVTVVDTTPPVIACPDDQTLECTAEGAMASFVPTVTDNCGTASVQCTPPAGTTFSEDAAPTAVSCIAVDTSSNQVACGFQITVQDTLPPVVTPKLEADGFSATLWPPNHSYHTVTLTDCIQSVADQCDGALPVGGTILRVTSDEPESGVGEDDDGTCDDIVLVDSTTVKLRAERSDESDGRVYSIFALISDDHGNQAPLTCKVQVQPHHKKAAVEGAAAYCVGQGCGSVPGNGPLCRHDGDDGDRGDDGNTRQGHR